MPFQKERYPVNWKEISQAIRKRAKNRCEWCNVPNGAVGYRDEIGGFHVLYNSIDGVDLQADALAEDGVKLIRIVLTVAHLGVPLPDGTPGDKRNKMDVRPENLAALCQRCHLNYDRDEHKENAARTRRRRKIESGQLELIV